MYQEKPTTSGNSLMNFFCVGNNLTTLAVIVSNYIVRCKSNYHTTKGMTATTDTLYIG